MGASHAYLITKQPVAKKLPKRNFNITTQLSHIFKVFEDFTFVHQLREELEKVKPIVVNFSWAVDNFRTANWVEIIKYPELVDQKSVQFLSA